MVGTVMKLCDSMLVRIYGHEHARKNRIDAPGTLSICRGIERRRIFINDVDRDDFVMRLSHLVSDSGSGKPS